MSKTYILRGKAAWACFGLVTLIANLVIGFLPQATLLTMVIGSLWLFLLPGWLIVRLLRLRTHSPWERLGFSVGFSVLAVMFTGLVVNTLLPLIGHGQPLDRPELFACLNVAW